MADTQAIRYDLKKLTPDLVLTFNITTEFKLRYWLALSLIHLAAWVLGCGIEVEDSKEPRPCEETRQERDGQCQTP